MTLYILFGLVLLALLAVLLPPVAAADGPRRQRILFAAAVSGFFVIGAFGLYYMLGAPEIIPMLAAREEKMAALKQVIVRRSEQIKADPKNLPAWVELGESFMETGQFHAAANAFRQAVLLSGGQPALIMAYAEAQVFDAGGNVTDDAKKALEMVLVQQPDNPDARYYMAVRQLQDGHTQEAMKAMKALYASLPADSPLKEKIDRQIGRR